MKIDEVLFFGGGENLFRLASELQFVQEVFDVEVYHLYFLQGSFSVLVADRGW